MSKKFYWLKIIIYFFLAAIFFSQTFTEISIIPIGQTAQFLGIPHGAIKLFFMMFVAFGVYIIKDFVISMLGYSSTDKIRAHNFGQYMRTFLLVWVTFFSYGILQALGIIQKEVLDDQIINWYIFWLFFSEFLMISLYYLLKNSGKHITYKIGRQEKKWPE